MCKTPIPELTKLFYPSGIERIWHCSADGNQKYRLDGIEKLVRLKNMLGTNYRYNLVTVDNGDISLLNIVHTSDYLDALRSGVPRELAESSGLLWQPSFIQVFANSAQALVLASKEALNKGQSGAISKGGHHALASRGFGFNPVNEIAICIAKLQSENPNLRIAVIDLDIHLGNGLHHLLADRPNTLLLDIWSKTHKKWGTPIDATNITSIKVKSKDEYWTSVDAVITKTKEYAPDLVIYHSGMDVFAEDRLGGISGFVEEDIQKREKAVIESFPQGLVLVLGGGYVNHSTPEKSKQGMQKLVELHKGSFTRLKAKRPI